MSLPPPARVHIIGGGLAGLSAAVELAPQTQVRLYEAGPSCGGRARSYYDRALETEIDNGNHLLLSANPYTFRYLDLLGARDTLRTPGGPLFPWYDLRDGLAWHLNLGRGRVPYWLLSPHTRVPGMRLREMAGLRNLLRAGPDEVVADCLVPGEFSRRLLEPLAVSALNTDIDSGSAQLLGTIVRRTLAKGGTACQPWMAARGLSRSFVTPALDWLKRCHAEVHTGQRITEIVREKGRVTALNSASGPIRIGRDEAVILAVPPVVASTLLPEVEGPDAFESIVNAHFRLPVSTRAKGVVGKAGFVGLVGGMAEWVFLHDRVLSVTVSAANRFADIPSEVMLNTIWEEISQALNSVLTTPLPLTRPRARLIREKRATFAATPLQARRRPGAVTSTVNLALAGDWTDTGLPSTIEGAIQSGLAAVAALGFRSGYSKQD
ncbi:hydroxysqualene dehydroxylase HpnE [Oecophyllibacter saccharovorans]|uniref:hydroxysqualene dehydroxylase HpnE n=1 Tax=Oecophyllibacter saccharovorans TaxID=2558360 RepID=UPI001F4FFC48|nr:hydroxysqualene dehydroxylase HpnE [Oecophyllibacter saccharovorans]